MALTFSTVNSIVQNSYINIQAHDLYSGLEVKYDYGQNATPTSIGIAAGIYYVFVKDSNNFYIIQNKLFRFVWILSIVKKLNFFITLTKLIIK